MPSWPTIKCRCFSADGRTRSANVAAKRQAATRWRENKGESGACVGGNVLRLMVIFTHYYAELAVIK